MIDFQKPFCTICSWNESRSMNLVSSPDRRWFDVVVDFIYPPRCLRCDTSVKDQGSLCSECWSEVDFIDGAICATCGQPFELDPGEGALCGNCIALAPLYDQARSVMVYNEASRPLVTGFKYGDRTERAPSYGRWMARAGKEFLSEADLLVPVPLHSQRLVGRRFSQSAMLAQAVARETLVPVLLDGLRRTRPTRQQVGLTTSKRRRNVMGAFSVHPKRSDQLRDSHVVLVDDVVTSGATVDACLKALQKAGVSKTSVLSLARVQSWKR
jgi:ComF family protein